MKLQQAEDEGGEWQNFGWCVREEDGMTGLEDSVKFLGRIMEEEVLSLKWFLLWFLQSLVTLGRGNLLLFVGVLFFVGALLTLRDSLFP
jgi:hypothetical protein